MLFSETCEHADEGNGKEAMRKRVTPRFVNGVIALVITVAFIVHGVLGSVSGLTGYTSPFTWLIWGAVGLVGAHVVASVVTSYQQLTDSKRPPSPRKKRHLLLKWVTGGLLAVAAAGHILLPKGSAIASVAIIIVAVTLAVHLCVGAKSLLKDLGADARHKMAFRVAVCAFAALFALGALVILVR